MTPEIAHAHPFEGAPILTVPSVFGASPEKPFLWRISVLGKRPIVLTADGLPDGLSLSDNTIRGTAIQPGEYTIRLRAENELGSDEKNVRLKIAPDGMLLTPLLGFTTWNAIAADVSAQFVTDTAKELVSSGLSEYGYAYVNIDSGWQGEYGGELDAIQPNAKFPDMRALTDFVHSLGLKCGIYSTPMLAAWGCPKEQKSIPGCTRGTPDDRFTVINGGIGVEHLEENNARQWNEWGFDYLKYDWRPTDPVNADPMKQALLRQPREIAFCTTVHCAVEYANYWKKHVNSWRDNTDTFDVWDNIVTRLNTVGKWAKHVLPGHFYDLDMLAVGPLAMNHGKCRLSPSEELFAFTMHAFFPSPVQLSCQLDKMTEFEFDLFANEEILAVNQDSLCDYPALIREYDTPARCTKTFARRLENGDYAVAFFNLGSGAAREEIRLPRRYAIRNLWQKKELGVSDTLYCEAGAHGAGVYRISCADN